jgi:hypothetical protein
VGTGQRGTDAHPSGYFNFPGGFNVLPKKPESVLLWVIFRGLIGFLTAVSLVACGPSAASPGGTIFVPPPASPQPEPSGLAQQQPNINHIHAVATRDGGRHLLLGNHRGIATVVPGGTPTSVGGGPKGDVLQLVYGGGSTFFAAGHNLGVWVSHDDGATWAEASPDVKGFDVHALAADPRQRTNLYAYAVGKGLLVSTDAGAHWVHRAGFADTNHLTGLTVTGDGTLLGGSPELGILASPDHGAGFVPVRNATGQVYSLASGAQNGDVVLVAAQTGIFLTQDGGKTWSVGDPNIAITGVDIDPADSKHLFAGTADGTLATSRDGGLTWGAY